MIDNRIIELINCDLDGSISRNEKDELVSALKISSEAKELYFKMTSLTEGLKAVKAVEPPVELKENIMRMLPEVRIKTVKKPGIIKSIATYFDKVPKFQLAGSFSFGFAAALVLMMLIISPERGNLVSPDATMGSIVLNETDGEFIEIASEQVQINDNSILISSSRSGAKIKLRMSLQNVPSAEIKIKAGSKSLGFISFERLSGSAAGFEIVDNYIEIKTISSGEWEIIFEELSTNNKEITVYIENNGSSISETIAIK
ncbi:MAG: hypothetical protein IIA17_02715 [candidate division Zixibacteria bacterium]|nr:hypothetical protein [candidate division Zixibacteria bacterium]